MNERVDDAADRLPAIDRRISEVRNDMLETRREVNARLARIEQTLDKNFARNFKEHEVVQAKADEIAQTVAPTWRSKIKDYATIVSLLLVPILAAYVAAGGAR